MKNIDARRIYRIARNIFMDVVSTRMAGRILSGLLRVGASDGGDVPRNGKYYNASGKCVVNGVEFEFRNATFQAVADQSGTGVFFPYWNNGVFMKSGNVIEITGRSQFGLKEGQDPGTCMITWKTGTASVGGKKFDFQSKCLYAMSNNGVFWTNDRDFWNRNPDQVITADGAYDKAPVTGRFFLNQQHFTVVNARFTVSKLGGGKLLDFNWLGGKMVSKYPVIATGMFRDFTGRVTYMDASIDCSDATFELYSAPGNAPVITWKKGVWHDGVFTNGRWQNGTWEDGIWYYGIWHKGDWKKGRQAIPNTVIKTGPHGSKRKEYVWNKKDTGMKLIDRTTPPTNTFPPVLTVTKKGKKYDLPRDADGNPAGGEWTKDDTGAPIQDWNLYPVQVSDEMNFNHMYGDDSHKGRNKFMQDIAKMCKDPSEPAPPGFNDPGIYEIYYDTKDTNRTLYVLYENGYLKIFHMVDDDQSIRKGTQVLKPATHNPVSLLDLETIAKTCEVFDRFVPTPDGKLLVKTRSWDRQFSERIVRIAFHVSRLRIFDPNALDKLFNFVSGNGSPAQKQKMIDDFTKRWKAAVEEFEKLSDDTRVDVNSIVIKIDDLREFLILMEKVQLILKDDTNISKKKGHLDMFNKNDLTYLNIINKRAGGTLTSAALEAFVDTSDSTPADFWTSYDKIMDVLQDDSLDLATVVK